MCTIHKAGAAPCIDAEGEAPLLQQLIWPLGTAAFLSESFRRRAVATVGATDLLLRDRVEAIEGALCGLERGC